MGLRSVKAPAYAVTLHIAAPYTGVARTALSCGPSPAECCTAADTGVGDGTGSPRPGWILLLKATLRNLDATVT